MIVKIQKFFLLTVGLLLCLVACDNEQANILRDNILSGNQQQPPVQPPTMDGGEITNAETSFKQDLLPILTAKCAFAGCHIAGGPKNLDFSTYQAFIKGGDGGPVFIAGNPQGSSIIAEIVSGRMPIGGPKLSDAEIQIFTDWINNQQAITVPPVDETPQPQIPQPGQPVSFEQHLLPILTAKCAYSGCHDANDPENLDFRTYQTFIRSAEREDVFVPGNARSSDIIEEIVSGRMPPGGPRLPNAEIQLFIDWINQQDPADFPNLRYDDDDYDDDDYDDDDYDDDDYDDDDYDDDDYDDDDYDDDDYDDDDYDDDDDDDDDYDDDDYDDDYDDDDDHDHDD